MVCGLKSWLEWSAYLGSPVLNSEAQSYIKASTGTEKTCTEQSTLWSGEDSPSFVGVSSQRADSDLHAHVQSVQIWHKMISKALSIWDTMFLRPHEEATHMTNISYGGFVQTVAYKREGWVGINFYAMLLDPLDSSSSDHVFTMLHQLMQNMGYFSLIFLLWKQ